MQIQSASKGCMVVLYMEPLLTLPSFDIILREKNGIWPKEKAGWLAWFTCTRLCRLELESSSWHPEPAPASLLPQSRDIASWRQQDHQLADTTTISWPLVSGKSVIAPQIVSCWFWQECQPSVARQHQLRFSADDQDQKSPGRLPVQVGLYLVPVALPTYAWLNLIRIVPKDWKLTSKISLLYKCIFLGSLPIVI